MTPSWLKFVRGKRRKEEETPSLRGYRVEWFRDLIAKIQQFISIRLFLSSCLLVCGTWARGYISVGFTIDLNIQEKERGFSVVKLRLENSLLTFNQMLSWPSGQI